jgi:hypothetical protein
MEFFLEKTSHTPFIKFDSGVLVISGRSIPEDSTMVYEPLFEFIERYIKNPLALTEIDISLEYANSSTNRSLMTIFESFESMYADGHEVKTTWYFSTGDQEMEELGNDFKSLIKIPFEIKELE